MEAFPSFDSGLNSNSNDFEFEDVYFMHINDSQQRQTNGDRNNSPTTDTSLVSSAQTNFYGNMLPTPESTGSDAVCPESLILSPYNIGHLDTFKEDDFFLEPSFINYFPGLISPQISPTLPPDASTDITSNSLARRQNKKGRYSPITKHQRISSNNMSQNRRKPSLGDIGGNNNINSNKDNGNNNNSANGQNNAITNLPSIVTGSPNKLPDNSIAMFSFLELTSPLLNNMVATSIAPSLQDTMPNLNLGSNLVSDVTSTHSSTNILPCDSSSDSIARITPSSLMKMKKKQPNSPISSQNESQQQQQNQQKKQDQSQQLRSSPKDHSTFIAPTPPIQLSQIRTNTVATVTNAGAVSPSGTSSRKSVRSSPLALGPTKSPHSLKPTISPNLKPKLPGVLADEVAEQLANKSNYRSILEGTAKSLGISYSSDVHSSLESRRTTHKAAEQKRRDSLKQSFDELKKVVPYQSVSSKIDDDDNNNKSNSNGKSDGTMKNVSKLFLLKRAHDHIVELEQKSKEKDELIQKLKDELEEFKRAKRQKIEETRDNADNEIDTETKSEDEQKTSC